MWINIFQAEGKAGGEPCIRLPRTLFNSYLSLAKASEQEKSKDECLIFEPFDQLRRSLLKSAKYNKPTPS
jgi:hypothetical protein